MRRGWTSPPTPARFGARAESVDGIAGLEAALARAKTADRTTVVVIQTDPLRTTAEGGRLVGRGGARGV